MIDRESLARTFYGDAPTPPPWATDCPIRFEVWLAFAEAVRTVSVGDAAASLGITQQALRQRISTNDQPATKRGRTWRIFVRDVEAPVPPETETESDLENHHRVDVIIAVNEDYEYGPKWVLEKLRGEGGHPALPTQSNPVAVGSFLAVEVTFKELVHTIVPLTNLARKIRSARELGPVVLRQALKGLPFDLSPESESPLSPSASAAQVAWEERQLESRHEERVAHLAWFLSMLAAVAGRDEASIESVARLIETANPSPTTELPEIVATRVIDRRRRYPVQTVNLNRKASAAVSRSRTTIKADAAEQLFAVDTSALTWAVVDSGIDALHPAFALRDEEGNPVQDPGAVQPRTRVVRSFDLMNTRHPISADVLPSGLIDWAAAIPWVEIIPPVPVPGAPATGATIAWRQPGNPHGSHVAGILAGDWPENGLRGICPGLRLYDFRVLDDAGGGNEFSIVAALQLIRHLNEQAGRLVIMGVNLSLSVPHDVANHSCGWTPVCVECDRLSRSGVVVVAAAGNAGFQGPTLTTGFGYHTVSVSDPGNTDSIITVGSTHRSDPHRHGVSYFSSRGPTADGRQKPDLLAPGEDIDGPVPGRGLQAMHGTSQAAAHVSGAAAMLMARYRELIGRPERIKEILCTTATDLGRERTFQGAGLVDALRAMQSI